MVTFGSSAISANARWSWAGTTIMFGIRSTMEAMRRIFWRVPSGSRSAHSLEEQRAFFEVCQAFALPDEVAHECVAHIVGQCDKDDDASGGVSGCGNADDRAVAVDVMAAREPECDTSGRWRTWPAPVARTDKRDPPGPRREC